MVASRLLAVDVDTGLEGDGEDVVVVLAIVIERKRFSDLKLLLIVNVFIINQVIKSIMHIVNEILLGIFFVIIFFVALGNQVLKVIIYSKTINPASCR